MGYIHRYWVETEGVPELPNPPNGLRPARFHAPGRGDWYCIDVQRTCELDHEYARVVSLAKGVRVVLGFLEETVSGTERCVVVSEGKTEPQPTKGGSSSHHSRQLAESLLGFDPWGPLGPRIGVYRDRSRDVGLGGLCVSFVLLTGVLAFCPKHVTLFGLAFASSFVAAYLWLPGRAVARIGGGLLAAAGLALAAALGARLIGLVL